MANLELEAEVSISSFTMMFGANGKMKAAFIVIYKQRFYSLNNIVLIFFIFALTYSMSEVSGSDLNKH